MKVHLEKFPTVSSTKNESVQVISQNSNGFVLKKKFFVPYNIYALCCLTGPLSCTNAVLKAYFDNGHFKGFASC